MNSSFLWKIGGEAGFGIMTVGYDFAKIATQMGYHTADYAEYPSLIRGGHNTYEVHISHDKIYASKHHIDLLVCLNKQTHELHKGRLGQGSVVLYDKTMFESDDHIIDSKFHIDGVTYMHIPMKQMLKDHEGSIVQMNTIMLGATMAVMNWPLKLVLDNIQKTFGGKGKEVVELNSIMAKEGHDHVVTDYKDRILYTIPPRASSDPKVDEQLVLTGNDAFALGAVVADCRMYVAYPMTPSSTVLSTLAEWAKTTGMVVRHAEDEISVVNTAIGGAFSGVRAACGTSGGGFALMVESLSYAGVTETPLVVFLSQRPGPATGLPTWTAQGDLLFAINAGHGEFPKIVLAPGDIEEMYQLSAEAFNLADIYQTPVIVMSDKHLSESHWSISKTDFNTFAKEFVIDRGKIVRSVSENEKYLRYKVTDDGISPMLLPGQKGVFFQANSYEHEEDGHTTEDGEVTIAQTNKRNRKLNTYLIGHYKAPNIYGDTGMATHIFVSWGSTKGVIHDAMTRLELEGIKCAHVHFTHVWPLDEAKVKDILTLFPGSPGTTREWILVENNSHAQFAQLIKMATGIEFENKLLKYDGRQIFAEDIIDYVHGLSSKK